MKPGAGPSPDGMWSVEEVECLAGCGLAPCIQVNHDVYDELVDEQKLIEVMEACKRGEYRPWANNVVRGTACSLRSRCSPGPPLLSRQSRLRSQSR